MLHSTYDVVKTASNRPKILLIGSGHQQYREYLLAALSDHADILLLEYDPVSWQKKYVLEWDVLPSEDTNSIVEYAIKFVESHAVDGCVTWDEFAVIATARICDLLNLPGFGVDAAKACRDKLLTRKILSTAQISQPDFRSVSSLEDAYTALDELGFPSVIKPRSLGASLGVSVINNADDLESAFSQAANIGEADVLPSKDLIIESALVGEEVSVDCLVIDGETTLLFCAKKTIGFTPFCEEIAHAIDPSDDLIKDPSIIELLATSHTALGVQYGITHTEIILTDHGPSIVEVNARWGGDLIPYLGMKALGYDLGAITVSAATGRPNDFSRKRNLAAVISFQYPKISGRVTGIYKYDLPNSFEDVQLELEQLAFVGDILYLPPKERVSGRFGYVIAVSHDLEMCWSAISEVEPNFNVLIASSEESSSKNEVGNLEER